MRDNTYQKEGREKVIVGISKATDMIRGSYGAAGGNVIVEEALYPYHRITNDGKLIVQGIKFADPLENMGANVIKEAGDKADKDSGDGRKTTMILTDALFQAAGESAKDPMALKRSLDACVPLIFDALDAQKKPIEIKDVEAVAKISSENEMFGRLIREIYEQIGKHGIVEVDHSNLPETFYEVTEGVRLRGAKFFGEYSCTEPGKAVYKNPKILITKEKITSVDQLENILKQLRTAGINELVIYCDDIDLSVATRLAITHLQGGFKTLLIKAPTLWKDWIFEDFAKITGAKIVDSKTGKTFKNLMVADLGTCEKIITTKDETRVIGIQDISEHVKELEALNTDDSRLRLMWLQTKVAILKVGANSESELSYLTKKATDACSAAYLALKDGVVPGGGIALLNAADELPYSEGGQILRKALRAPYEQICKNMGIIARRSAIPFGDDVMDPLLVVKNAVKNAVSIAGTILTVSGAIIIPKQDDPSKNMPAM